MTSAPFLMSLPNHEWKGPPRPERQYDSELDNVISILHDACDAFASDSTIRFHVSGFGDERWPVDVRTDLAVAVHQVPQMIDHLRHSKECSIDFFEQGIERYISAAVRGTRATLTCRSLTRWQPNPPTIETDVEQFVETLVGFLIDFQALLGACFPWATTHPWVIEWLRPARLSQ